MGTFASLQRMGLRRLRDARLDTAGLDARLLLCHAAGLTHERLVAQSNESAGAQVNRTYLDLLNRRERGEPVARILGEKEFWGLPFILNADTLVPRPDSESIVRAALDGTTNHNAPLRVLDLGTGSGCLLLALLSELPNARGIGADVSENALVAAKANAGALGFARRADFVQSNWADAIDDTFDIVLSNPPYIPAAEVLKLDREVREHDPGRALDGGIDGLECYRVLLAQLPNLLADEGAVVLETSPNLYADLFEMVRRDQTFARPTGFKDLAGHWRGLRFGKGNLAA